MRSDDAGAVDFSAIPKTLLFNNMECKLYAPPPDNVIMIASKY